jgi:hypothetical protein
MQYQIITGGKRLWAKDGQAGVLDAMILSQKTDLDADRAALLADIQREGTVFGKSHGK